MSKQRKSKNNNSLLPPGITKKEKVKRAKYLTKRIVDLFQNISDWSGDDYSLKKKLVLIDGEKLPAADIYSGKKIIISLRPVSLWAFGVNCRIDIVSGKETNIIFDIAKENSPPDWQLVSSEAGKKPKKLTKVIFRNLLKKNN